MNHINENQTNDKFHSKKLAPRRSLTITDDDKDEFKANVNKKHKTIKPINVDENDKEKPKGINLLKNMFNKKSGNESNLVVPSPTKKVANAYNVSISPSKNNSSKIELVSRNKDSISKASSNKNDESIMKSE